MKKIYVKPQINTITVKTEDVITLSLTALQDSYKNLDIHTNVVDY